MPNKLSKTRSIFPEIQPGRTCFYEIGLVCTLMLGLIILFFFNSATKKTEQINTTSFHTLPIGHKSLIVSNFNGSLVWSDQELSGSPVTSHRKRLMPPVQSDNGVLKVRIPFQTRSLFLEGAPASDSFITFTFED